MQRVNTSPIYPNDGGNNPYLMSGGPDGHKVSDFNDMPYYKVIENNIARQSMMARNDSFDAQKLLRSSKEAESSPAKLGHQYSFGDRDYQANILIQNAPKQNEAGPKSSSVSQKRQFKKFQH